MGASVGMRDGSSGGGRGRRALILGLLGISFLVFVAGSFVFSYLFLFSVSLEPPKPGMPSLPTWLDVPSLLPASSPAEAGEKATPSVIDTAGRKVINILLLGVDQRNDEKGAPTRSDTMMVVSVDLTNKRAAMISLPRDMWVQIPGYADNRINVANFLGDAYDKPKDGPILAEKTIELNFGLNVDYYARIDFRGFEKIVDTLGGVDINVDQAIRDDQYPTEDYETMSIYIPAGPQHMNGTVALQYARSRHSENDFGRAKRQQKLLVAIKDRALALDVIPKLPSLMSNLMGMVQTDVPVPEILQLANAARDVDSKNVKTLVIDDKLAPGFVGEGGADLLMPNKPAIRRAIAALVVDPVVQNEAATIEVQNGTAKEGLATKAGDYLLDQGFDVVKVTGADRTDYKTTRISASEATRGTANLLATALKLGPQAVVLRPAPTATPAPSKAAGEVPEVRVILGQDYSPPR